MPGFGQFTDATTLATASYRHWQIRVADIPEVMSSPAGKRLATLKVMSQTPYDDLRSSFPLEVQTTGGFGAPSKGTTPSGRGPHTASFASTWKALHNAMDIRPIRDALGELGTFLPGMGRPPIVMFQWAGYAMLCYLSVDIAWEKGTHITGLPKGFTATITLTEAVDRPLDQTRHGTEPSTNYHILAPGETFEHLAWMYLGDPGRGPLIRRMNPQIVEETAGLTVKILPGNNSAMRGPVAPASAPFATGWEDVFEAFAAARGGA